MWCIDRFSERVYRLFYYLPYHVKCDLTVVRLGSKRRKLSRSIDSEVKGEWFSCFSGLGAM